MSTWTRERSRIASLSRFRPADDPEITEARRNMRALQLEEHVARVVAGAPPLSTEQRHKIAQILAPHAIFSGVER